MDLIYIQTFHMFEKNKKMEGFLNSYLAAAPMSPADNLCKWFGPRRPEQDGQNIGPDLDPNRLTL